MITPVNAAIGTLAAVWTPATGRRVRLTGGDISVTAAGYVEFQDADNANAVLYRTPKLLADTPFRFTLPGAGVVMSKGTTALKAVSSVSATIIGSLFGEENHVP